MARFSLIVTTLLGAWTTVVLNAVDPIPEQDQAARAMKIIDAFHGPRPARPPKKLHLVYFTPADREPAARYEQRLEAIIEDVRAFYRDGMERLGFGPKTFTLDRDAQGKLIFHFVKGKEPANDFPRWKGRNGGNTGAVEGGDMVKAGCKPALETDGITFDRETVLIFCNLANWDEKALTFRHWSPYFGSWTQTSGLCFAADWSNQDLTNLVLKAPKINDGEYGNMSLGKHITIFAGGIAHELGHALALPHCGARWDEKNRGTSLMGSGNHTYREERRGEGKGSFLTMASAMRLAGRSIFNGSDKDEARTGLLTKCVLNLSTNVTSPALASRRAALRLQGTVEGTPPVYGVIAYFDSIHDGGYSAPTTTAVPDEDGKFAMEISDLAACSNGALTVEYCHANGAVSEQRISYGVTYQGVVDLSQCELRHALQPVADAVAGNQPAAARAALAELERMPATEAAKNIARKLASSLDTESKPVPATVPDSIEILPLGDAKADSARVGWLAPAANRIPANDEIKAPFLESGKIFATGLYAHSPSRYAYSLGGKWKRLRGQAGVHTDHQPHGNVVFVIKSDGKELFRSRVGPGMNNPSYDVDVSGAQSLELIVEKAGLSNGGNWGLWLDPTLTR